VLRDRGAANGKPEVKPTDSALHIYTAGCDGICYDPVRNRMLLTASEQNGIYAWDIAQKKMSVLWSNGDTDGADGLLDQPCEVMMLDENRVLVVNIDAPSPFMVNTKADKVHTLSILTF